MKYSLQLRVLSGPYKIDLTKKEFDEYLFARDFIRMATDIEEAFDIFIDNYLDFENTLLQSTNQYLVRMIDTHETFHAERRLFNRKIENLLTTSRAYLYQAERHIMNQYGQDSPQLLNYKDKLRLEYDTHLGYRVIEALRNHVQHYGFPIHNVVYSGRVIGDIKNNPKWRFVITPFIMTKHLEQNKHFKKKILGELKLLEKKNGIDLKLLIREYVESLANMHIEARLIMQEHITQSEDLFGTAIKRFSEYYPQIAPYGLELISENNGEIATSVSFLKESCESRKNLEKKNKNLVNLSKRYVTNEILEKD